VALLLRGAFFEIEKLLSAAESCCNGLDPHNVVLSIRSCELEIQGPRNCGPFCWFLHH